MPLDSKLDLQPNDTGRTEFVECRGVPTLNTVSHAPPPAEPRIGLIYGWASTSEKLGCPMNISS